MTKLYPQNEVAIEMITRNTMKNLKDFQHDTESKLSNALDFLKEEFDEHEDIYKILGGVIVGVALVAMTVLLFSRKNLADRRKVVGNSSKGF